MEPEDLIPHSQELSIFSIPSRLNAISLIDTSFFKIHSNVVRPYKHRSSLSLLFVGLPVKIVKALIPSINVSTYLEHLLDLITLTILGERYKL